MLYELSTLVATAGSTNRPVLQARDRDPLHQHQVKQNDKKRCFANGYDSQHLFHGLFTHLDWTEHTSKTAPGSNISHPYPVDIRTQNKHTQLDKDGIVKFRWIANKAPQLRQTNNRLIAMKVAEVRALEFSHLSPAM
jgi:hypothetical protein